ncbi:MAG: hypothetical protein HQM16_10440 [Deltaproteobacteria bacterium]|nr:hypothetical protein [Deltaproteobacteria bacterium]
MRAFIVTLVVCMCLCIGFLVIGFTGDKNTRGAKPVDTVEKAADKNTHQDDVADDEVVFESDLLLDDMKYLNQGI